VSLGVKRVFMDEVFAVSGEIFKEKIMYNFRIVITLILTSSYFFGVTCNDA
jgi:hypothetical protein